MDEARRYLTGLVRAVAEGRATDILLTLRGKPAARLVSVGRAATREALRREALLELVGDEWRPPTAQEQRDAEVVERVMDKLTVDLIAKKQARRQAAKEGGKHE